MVKSMSGKEDIKEVLIRFHLYMTTSTDSSATWDSRVHDNRCINGVSTRFFTELIKERRISFIFLIGGLQLN